VSSLFEDDSESETRKDKSINETEQIISALSFVLAGDDEDDDDSPNESLRKCTKKDTTNHHKIFIQDTDSEDD
jgi:hypothetical protein